MRRVAIAILAAFATGLSGCSDPNPTPPDSPGGPGPIPAEYADDPRWSGYPLAVGEDAEVDAGIASASAYIDQPGSLWAYWEWIWDYRLDGEAKYYICEPMLPNNPEEYLESAKRFIEVENEFDANLDESDLNKVPPGGGDRQNPWRDLRANQYCYIGFGTND